jgi:prepilin-type N-terminal cleavage/methylation domain-containing protein
LNTREKKRQIRLRPAIVLFAQQHGFSMIEIAIVMVIIGLLAGGGISLMGMLTQRKARNETIDYLKQAEAALISFAGINGRLPWADTSGNGNENSGAPSGSLPYQTLKLIPTDPNKRVLKYAVNGSLGTDRTTSCNALRAGLLGGPAVVDADGAATSFQTAAILISAGPADADGDGNVFDRIGTGTHQGDNTDGSPNFLRYPPIDGFDDLVVYVGEHQLYAEICEFLSLAVNNNSGGIVYVHNRTQGSDLGALADGAAGIYTILSGTQIEILNGSGGSGTTVLPSTPPTPLALAGRGFTITLP